MTIKKGPWEFESGLSVNEMYELLDAQMEQSRASDLEKELKMLQGQKKSIQDRVDFLNKRKIKGPEINGKTDLKKVNELFEYFLSKLMS